MVLKVKHLKRGSVYEVLGRAKIQCETPMKDMDDVVVYRGPDGALWVRCKAEFEDGRFEPVIEETSAAESAVAH